MLNAFEKKKKHHTKCVSAASDAWKKIKSNLSTSEAVASCAYAEKNLTYAFIQAYKIIDLHGQQM